MLPNAVPLLLFFIPYCLKGADFILKRCSVLCCSVCGPIRPDSFIYHFILCCAVHTLRLLLGCRLTFTVALIEFWTVNPVSNAPREIKEILHYNIKAGAPAPLPHSASTLCHNTVRSNEHLRSVYLRRVNDVQTALGFLIHTPDLQFQSHPSTNDSCTLDFALCKPPLYLEHFM